MSLIRLTIESLSHEGRGIARHHGKTCFVTGALPGETVEARLVHRKARLEEYDTVTVLEASADRVTPPCALYEQCGGCDLQHLDAGGQIAHKQLSLLEQLFRQAGMEPDCIELPLNSAMFGYRRRARLAVWVPRQGGKAVLGFRERRGNKVVAVDHCPVLEPALSSLPAALTKAVAQLSYPQALGHIELSLSESTDHRDSPVVLLRSVAEVPEADRAIWTSLAIEQAAYVFLQDTTDGFECLHAPIQEAPGYCLPEFKLRLGYSGGDFVQANRVVNRALVKTVMEWLAPKSGEHMLDAFSGLGNFSLPMARLGAHVLGLEVAAGMVAQAHANALGNAVANVEFAVCDLQAEDVRLPTGHWDAVVLDPPRTGALDLVKAIAKKKIKRVLYVSCNPGTLARDAKVLAEKGYTLDRLALVDMFPQTAHIEALALFRR
jgi:23S rRNA (uracil1939-C5)-methyltransferase